MGKTVPSFVPPFPSFTLRRVEGRGGKKGREGAFIISFSIF